ncbi:MAG: PEP-CTERM sorting domain-containing protein, partial [Planctomycetales bacterium]|nr:PEP-CTERM sorting domain-containing protein [Planctomycetales bacterium]
RVLMTVTPNPSDATKALFDVILIQDVNGSAISHGLMNDVPASINLAGLPRNRVMAGARAVGGDLVADVDNFSVQFIPEPTTLGLVLLVATGLTIAGRRQR